MAVQSFAAKRKMILLLLKYDAPYRLDSGGKLRPCQYAPISIVTAIVKVKDFNKDWDLAGFSKKLLFQENCEAAHLEAWQLSRNGQLAIDRNCKKRLA